MADGDEFDPEIDEEEDEVEAPSEADRLRELRRAAKGGAKAKLEAAAAKRELAFMKAGVDTDSKIGALLLKSWDGDVSNVEALQAEAKEMGALKEGFGPADENATAGDPNETADRQALATGAAPDQAQELDPDTFSIDYAKKMMKDGRPWEQAAAEAFDDRMFAASKGDERVIWRNPFADR